MKAVLRKSFVIRPPADRPELLPHFEALAAIDGFRLYLVAEDEQTGESVMVHLDPTPVGQVAA